LAASKSRPRTQAFLAASCDLVFLAVPHGTAMEMAAELRGEGARVVDLSADFRLRDREVYESWYGVPHTRTALLAEAVYGLPELYAERIAGASLVANPGCYPTSAILALYPALAPGSSPPMIWSSTPSPEPPGLGARPLWAPCSARFPTRSAPTT
jgi:N-acetyl-gamma-glutamylphosphate reductase